MSCWEEQTALPGPPLTAVCISSQPENMAGPAQDAAHMRSRQALVPSQTGAPRRPQAPLCTPLPPRTLDPVPSLPVGAPPGHLCYKTLACRLTSVYNHPLTTVAWITLRRVALGETLGLFRLASPGFESRTLHHERKELAYNGHGLPDSQTPCPVEGVVVVGVNHTRRRLAICTAL